MDVRKEVIEGGFAGAVVVSASELEAQWVHLLWQYLANAQPTPQQPQPPNQLLEELRDILLHTFRIEFDAAAEKKDEQAVSRFFRLWPGIGAEREGLEAYGDFVVGLVKARNANTGKRECLDSSRHRAVLTPSLKHIILPHVVDVVTGEHSAYHRPASARRGQVLRRRPYGHRCRSIGG